MRQLLISVIVVGIFFLWFTGGQKTAAPQPRPTSRAPVTSASPAKPQAAPVAIHDTVPSPPPLALKAGPALRDSKAPKADGPAETFALPYVMEDGVAVVLGDVVIGAPTREDAPTTGTAEIPAIKLWTGRVIPFHIQPGVPQPERVREAIAMFDGTALRFVPYTNEVDALVFEASSGICKSYIGKIGGKQPVWLASDCGPMEIAHEILHAIGFIHEQNRADRDDFIDVHFENIEEQYKFNFEKLPAEFMKVSGLSKFDFESLMIYPVWMFARSGQSTMEPRAKDQQIRPGHTLSKVDVERILKAYGR